MEEEMKIRQCVKRYTPACPHQTTEEMLKISLYPQSPGPAGYSIGYQYEKDEKEVNEKYCLNCDKFEMKPA